MKLKDELIKALNSKRYNIKRRETSKTIGFVVEKDKEGPAVSLTTEDKKWIAQTIIDALKPIYIRLDNIERDINVIVSKNKLKR